MHFGKNYQTNSKIMWKYKEPRVTKRILTKKKKKNIATELT